MDELIKEVQQYFKTKMLTGDFTIESLETYKCVISIDEYKFTIWIGNPTIEETRRPYESGYNFIDIPWDNDIDSPILHHIMKDKLAPVIAVEKIHDYKQQIDRIRKEIDILKPFTNE
jgi:hypothetical protein